MLGRVFHYKHLLGYYPELGEQTKVKEDLDILAACELTPLDTPEPDLAYLFKHLITHEVAYELLTHTSGPACMRQYAVFLETRAGKEVDTIWTSWHTIMSAAITNSRSANIY